MRTKTREQFLNITRPSSDVVSSRKVQYTEVVEEVMYARNGLTDESLRKEEDDTLLRKEKYKQQLIHRLESSKAEDVAVALSKLLRLSSVDQFDEFIANSDILDHLFRLLLLKSWVALFEGPLTMILWNICTMESVQDRIINAKGVVSALMCIIHNAKSYPAVSAIGIIGDIATTDERARSLGRLGAVDLILTACKIHCSPHNSTLFLGALCNLTKSDENKRRIHLLQGTDIFIRYALKGSVKEMEICNDALRSMSTLPLIEQYIEENILKESFSNLCIENRAK
jgi:hypothetical protein